MTEFSRRSDTELDGRGRAPLVRITRLSKSFGPTAALSDVSLEVRAGEVHALLGANGAGKSTLIKILAGVYAQDSGSVEVDGHRVSLSGPIAARAHGIAVIHQQLSVIPSLTVAENLLVRSGSRSRRKGFGRDRNAAAAAATAALKSVAATVRADSLASALTFGERQLVEIALATSSKARVIVMDEPTSGLTQHEQKSLFDAIRKLTAHGVGIVYVSHKMNEVYEIADRMTVLRNGSKVAEFTSRDLDRDSVVSAILGATTTSEVPHYRHPGHGHNVPCAADAQPMLEIRNLSTERVAGVSFSIAPGEVLGIYGVVGSGAPQLAESLVGARPHSGEVLFRGRRVRFRSPRAARRAGITIVPADHRSRGVVPDLSIQENMLLGRGNWLRGMYRRVPRRDRARVSDLRRRLDVRCRSVLQPVAELSGGNQQKVVFARALFDEPAMLVLEDPTQGVDVGAKKDMFDELVRQRDLGVAILLISSEVSELSAMAHRVLVLRDGTIVGQLRGPEINDQAILALAAAEVSAR